MPTTEAPPHPISPEPPAPDTPPVSEVGREKQLEEEKEEIKVVPDIENVPTQDTVPDTGRSLDEDEDALGKPLIVKKLDSPSATTKTTATTSSAAKPKDQTKQGDDKETEDDDQSVKSTDTEDTATRQTRRESERKCGIYMFGIGFLGVAIAAILLLVAYANGEFDKSKNKDSGNMPTPPLVATPYPTVVVREPPTAAPVAVVETTATPTAPIPTVATTSPPTIGSLDLMAFLPPVTTEAMQDPTSPQSLAYTWWQQDPQQADYNLDRTLQRFALVTFYYATQGELWVLPPGLRNLFMNYDVNECQWMPAVAKEDACTNDDLYKAVELSNLQLNGTIPIELCLLLSPSTLEKINMRHNALRGTLPSELGVLSQLTDFDGTDNAFSGTLPEELFVGTENAGDVVEQGWNANNNGTLVTSTTRQANGGITNSTNISNGSDGGRNGMKLQQLRLGQNMLTGEIPPAIADLQDTLTSLVLSENQLHGTLTTHLGTLQGLISLQIDHNSWTGTVPTELQELTKLEKLYLDHNPSLMGWIAGDSENNLTAPTALHLGRLENLQELAIENTALFGTIPGSFCTDLQLLNFTCSQKLCGCDCGCGAQSTEMTTAVPTMAVTNVTMNLTSNSTTSPIVPTIAPSTSTDVMNLTAMNKTLSPTLEGQVTFVLPKYTMVALTDPLSAQAMAMQWLVSDPNFDTYSTYRQHQRFALATLYYATSGTSEVSISVGGESRTNATILSGAANWIDSKNWLAYDIHECDWYTSQDGDPCVTPDEVSPMNGAEIAVDDEPMDERRYANLALVANGLVGRIPPELALMTSLVAVDLSENMLNGSIPTPVLQDLVQLQELRLNENKLTGSLPAAIGSCLSLKTLDVSQNMLSGDLVPHLGNLTALETLNLANNRFQRVIPNELWRGLTNLQYLDLSSNSFKDRLNSNIGSLTRLTHLSLSKNLITGPIPFDIGRLKNLSVLDLSYNVLERLIPSTIGTLVNLEELRLNNNQFRGRLVEEVGNLQRLRGLYLHTTWISGQVPETVVDLPLLEALTINATLVSGTIPAGLCTLPGLNFTCSALLCGCTTCACRS